MIMSLPFMGVKKIQGIQVLLLQNQTIHCLSRSVLEEVNAKSACYCCPIKVYSQHLLIRLH